MEQMHWFLRERCNLERCAYCFGPTAVNQVIDLGQDKKIAQELVSEKVDNVVLGGGEPMTASNLDEILKILKEGGIYTSLHTNGLLLTEKKLDNLVGLVDEITLPIDSTDRNTQALLRGNKFLQTYDNLNDLAININDRGIDLGWHTVFTSLNSKDIPALYDFLDGQEFTFWRIYEYNDDLAKQGWLDSETNEKAAIAAYQNTKRLDNIGSPEFGATDCLLADFLRAEENMKFIGDSRVCFVARKDQTAEPYVFVRSNGDLNYYNWSSATKRQCLGNIFTDGLPAILAKAEHKAKHYLEAEKDERNWLEATGNMPLWARLWSGIGFIDEELEQVDKQYIPELFKLANLWLKRSGLDAQIKIEDYFEVV